MVHKKLVHPDALFESFTAVPLGLKRKEKFKSCLLDAEYRATTLVFILLDFFHLILTNKVLLFQFPDEETEAGKVKPPSQSCNLNK